MNRSFQNRLDKLSETNPQRVYVFWVPPGRTNEINLQDANLWLKEANLPARSNPMIFEDKRAKEMHVEVIEDFAAVIKHASNSGKRIGER